EGPGRVQHRQFRSSGDRSRDRGGTGQHRWGQQLSAVTRRCSRTVRDRRPGYPARQTGPVTTGFEARTVTGACLEAVPDQCEVAVAFSGATEWSSAVRADVETLWRFHRIDDELRPVDVAVGLGSHDGGVAVHTAELYHRGLFPVVVFTGANAPTTVERFPRGEAVHFREIALEHGVPDEAIRIETRATNTVQNIDHTRTLLAAEGITPRSVLIVSRPYQQRRAQAIAAHRCPDVDI